MGASAWASCPMHNAFGVCSVDVPRSTLLSIASCNQTGRLFSCHQLQLCTQRMRLAKAPCLLHSTESSLTGLHAPRYSFALERPDYAIANYFMVQRPEEPLRAALDLPQHDLEVHTGVFGHTRKAVQCRSACSTTLLLQAA